LIYTIVRVRFQINTFLNIENLILNAN